MEFNLNHSGTQIEEELKIIDLEDGFNLNHSGTQISFKSSLSCKKRRVLG